MTKIIAISNQKGGVGKTTTCVNLAASLVAMKQKVLVIDVDPQGNATMGSGINKNNVVYSTYDVLVNRIPISHSICHADVAGYDLLPSNSNLTAAEVELLKFENKEYILRDAIEDVKGHFDFVLIDCPPSLNMLTIVAFVAAQRIIIPVQCEYYALEGLSALVQTIEQIKHTVNPKLEIEGLLRTMVDPRNRLSGDVSKQLISYFGEKVYRTTIPRNVRLAEAPSHGLSVLHYDRYSSGSTAYLAMAGELVRRINKMSLAA